MLTDDLYDRESANRENRIDGLRAQAEKLSGGEMSVLESTDAPAEVIEQFWRNVVAAETEPWISDREQLARDGFTLPDPKNLTDEQVSETLNELILQLGLRRVYLLNTDHLDDRQLYAWLLDGTLDEDHPQIPADAEGGWFIDIVGSGSEEDTRLYLKYYADEPFRRQWKEDWPEDEIPDHEDPPHDRDRYLPGPVETF